MTDHRQEEGNPTARKARFAAVTSASVDDIAVDVCFLENAVKGKNVLGPTRANKHPLVERLSCSPAWSESANNHVLHSAGESPMKPIIVRSIVECIYDINR